MSERTFAAWLQSNEDRHDEAPDIRVLWTRTSRARKPYVCDACGEVIAFGERYESTGLIEDGVFRHERRHFGAYQFPSGCPRIGQQDRAEAEEQFRRDEALFNPKAKGLPS